MQPDAYEPIFDLPSSGLSCSQWTSKYYSDMYKQAFNAWEELLFILYFICKFLLVVPGLRITKEYLNLAICMAIRKQMSLAPFVLGTLYKGLFTFVDKEITNACGGPLWVFQAWLYAYFPQIKPKNFFDLREPDDRGSRSCYAEMLLSFYPDTEDASFERYFRTLYDSLTRPNFNLFAKLEYASEKLKPFFEDSKE